MINLKIENKHIFGKFRTTSCVYMHFQAWKQFCWANQYFTCIELCLYVDKILTCFKSHTLVKRVMPCFGLYCFVNVTPIKKFQILFLA